jgi:glucosyl-3-phosphoglycerate phosphatase
MPKLVDLIRHGQSTFNAACTEAGSDPLHYDARLTPLGHAQVAAARAMLGATKYDLVVTTPFSRAVETALGLFGAADVPILVEALHRERLESSCDIGRSKAELARDFPNLVFDHLDDPWWHDCAEKNALGHAIEPEEVFIVRVHDFRRWLMARPEPRIAVIGHGTFFRHLTGVPLANCEVLRWSP